MIKIGNLELNPNMAWAERGLSYGVEQSLKVTLGGRTVVRAAPLVNGAPITLVASQDSGWLTTTMVEALHAMAANPGQVVFMTFWNDLVNVPVVFRHNEPPALALGPLLSKAIQEPGDFWIGTIKLLRV